MMPPRPAERVVLSRKRVAASQVCVWMRGSGPWTRATKPAKTLASDIRKMVVVERILVMDPRNGLALLQISTTRKRAHDNRWTTEKKCVKKRDLMGYEPARGKES